MSRVLNFIFARSYFIHVVIGLSVAIIICGYFFRSYISAFMHDIVQITLDLTGFGIALPLVWLCVLCFALIKRKFDFKNIRYLISLVISPICVIGLLGLTSTQLQGNYFYGDFQIISLGGSLGLKISGENLWLGIIRLVIIGLVMISIGYPKLILAIAVGLWKLTMMIYVGFALIVSSMLKKKGIDAKINSERYEWNDEIVLEEKIRSTGG